MNLRGAVRTGPLGRARAHVAVDAILADRAVGARGRVALIVVNLAVDATEPSCALARVGGHAVNASGVVQARRRVALVQGCLAVVAREARLAVAVVRQQVVDASGAVRARAREALVHTVDAVRFVDARGAVHRRRQVVVAGLLADCARSAGRALPIAFLLQVGREIHREELRNLGQQVADGEGVEAVAVAGNKRDERGCEKRNLLQVGTVSCGDKASQDQSDAGAHRGHGRGLFDHGRALQ